MSTPHQSAVDAYCLSCGPFLDGTPVAVDGELVRLALDARPRRLARLRRRWHAARLRRLDAIDIPTGGVTTAEELVRTRGPIRAEAARGIVPT
jgi:hypothetical protein